MINVRSRSCCGSSAGQRMCWRIARDPETRSKSVSCPPESRWNHERSVIAPTVRSETRDAAFGVFQQPLCPQKCSDFHNDLVFSCGTMSSKGILIIAGDPLTWLSGSGKMLLSVLLVGYRHASHSSQSRVGSSRQQVRKVTALLVIDMPTVQRKKCV